VAEITTQDGKGPRQKIISLCILDNQLKEDPVDGSLKPLWTVHEPAYLPVIKHGDFAGAVAVEKLAANKSISAESIYLDIPSENLPDTSKVAGEAQQVPALTLLKYTQGEKFEDYQLKFIFGTPLTFGNLAKRPKTGALILGRAEDGGGGILGWHSLTRSGYANLNPPTVHSAPTITIDEQNNLIITREDNLQSAFQFVDVKVYYIGNLFISNLVENSNVFTELGKNFEDVNGSSGYRIFYPEKNEFVDLPELDKPGNYIISVTYTVTGSVDGENLIKKTFIAYNSFIIDKPAKPTSGGKALEVSLDENNKLVIKIKDNGIDLPANCFIKCWVYYLGNIRIENLEENYKALADIGRNFPDINSEFPNKNSEVGYTIYDEIEELPELSTSGNYVVAVKYKNNTTASETYVKYLPLVV
jgi:hypothetical protein